MGSNEESTNRRSRLNPDAAPFYCDSSGNTSDSHNNRRPPDRRRYYGSGRTFTQRTDFNEHKYRGVGHSTSRCTGESRQVDKNWRSNMSTATYVDSTILQSKCFAELSISRPNDDAPGSQRERLADMLMKRTLECLICCDRIKNNADIWSCSQCYLILHLNCTITWAKSVTKQQWPCPACQYLNDDVPSKSYCFCGKVQNPRSSYNLIPHSCGAQCLKIKAFCMHKCMILCHPGPCPECDIMTERRCGCGVTSHMVKCSNRTFISCSNVCNLVLKCGVHKCKKLCHPRGECDICDVKIPLRCFCGKEEKVVICNADNAKLSDTYKCANICDKLLGCNNHRCTALCHEGDCVSCSFHPSKLSTCPCGKTALTVVRNTCVDPIPCCDNVCGKFLNCGEPNSKHRCKGKCHIGPCPPCDLYTWVKCRCKHMDKKLACIELESKTLEVRCDKKCTHKQHCGRHRCNQRCCIDPDHICLLPCNRALGCGLHRCSLTCHSSRCPPCDHTSFQELYCECGAEVIYPPVACGTKPPFCQKQCSRPRPCGHRPLHTCHPGPCPPCTVLCKKWCLGKHEQRSTIPCHQSEFSCGLPCGRPMSQAGGQDPCIQHKCPKLCHKGPCPVPCRQPCTVPRPFCGHTCNAPCHPKKSCDTIKQPICRFVVSLTCICGLQKEQKMCHELHDQYHNLRMSLLNEKMLHLKQEGSVNLQTNDDGKLNTVPAFTSIDLKKPILLIKVLECNEECRVFERNRRLAIGLQIRNPDLSQKLMPRYSDTMRAWAKRDPAFCQRIHDKLTDLVELSKQSKQKSRSHSFESMNRDKRSFIHECCEHFGCESAAYDAEPNRNVVATAFKEKSWLPSMSLLDVLQRENGQRKVPGPTPTTAVSTNGNMKLQNMSGSASADSNNTTSKATINTKNCSTILQTQMKSADTIDYFNYPPA